MIDQQVQGDPGRGLDAAQELNPAQQDVLEVLGARQDARPTFPATLRNELRDEIELALEPLAEPIARITRGGQRPFAVNKHALTQVHGCEARSVAERDSFSWTPATARGVVAHKAVELGVHWTGEPVPRHLVDEALATLVDDTFGPGEWLAGASEAELAELRSVATDRVTTFFDVFPPLDPRWRPVLESRVRVEALAGRVVLSGKVDLALGQARGTTAGKVLVDLKTGGTRSSHVDDLRFYALLETIKVGVPPRIVASAYLDQGMLSPEAVTEDVLAAALHRTVAGISRLVALAEDPAAATRSPGPLCRWCPLVDESCPEGEAYIAETDGWG
jgi:hypothetical protein